MDWLHAVCLTLKIRSFLLVEMLYALMVSTAIVEDDIVIRRLNITDLIIVNSIRNYFFLQKSLLRIQDYSLFRMLFVSNIACYARVESVLSRYSAISVMLVINVIISLVSVDIISGLLIFCSSNFFPISRAPAGSADLVCPYSVLLWFPLRWAKRQVWNHYRSFSPWKHGERRA